MRKEKNYFVSNLLHLIMDKEFWQNKLHILVTRRGRKQKSKLEKKAWKHRGCTGKDKKGMTSIFFNYLINFIKEVEWRWITLLDGKDQPKGNQRFLTTRELVHFPHLSIAAREWNSDSNTSKPVWTSFLENNFDDYVDDIIWDNLYTKVALWHWSMCTEDNSSTLSPGLI